MLVAKVFCLQCVFACVRILNMFIVRRNKRSASSKEQAVLENEPAEACEPTVAVRDGQNLDRDIPGSSTPSSIDTHTHIHVNYIILFDVSRRN